ncbi:MAG: type II toxin-antitoxin system RelE/ParE family toxin [Phycisphaerae bacterium]
MKRHIVFVTRPALDEMYDAYRYIAAEAPIAADRWHRGIERAIGSLATSPRRCRFAPESSDVPFELRQHRYGQYRILSTIDGDRVEILHVRPGARDQMQPDEILPPE